MKKNYTALAIKIVMRDDLRHESGRLLAEIAASHPAALVAAATKIGLIQIDPRAAAIEECRKLMLAGDKIPAIKFWREFCGAGLKESKDFVESLV